MSSSIVHFWHKKNISKKKVSSPQSPSYSKPGLGSRVFLAPWSRSRLKKKRGAGAAWKKKSGAGAEAGKN